MTGVEVAGLVLGAFPLVISGVQGYREGLKTLRTWWKYRSEVLELSAAIESQHLMFLQNIELLLDPIITSSSQMKRLLNSTGSCTADPLWQDVEVISRLKRRLSVSYTSYMGTVLGMSKSLEDLQSTLGIVDGNVTPITQICAYHEKVPQDQLKRIKFSFLKKGLKKLVNELDRGNAVLRQLLGDNDKLASGRARRNVDIPTSWEEMSQRAQSLFQVLVSSWDCQCSATHCANLLLGDWVSGTYNEGPFKARKDCDFKLWFSVGMNPDTKTAFWDSHHVTVKSLSFPSAKTIPNSLNDLEANVEAKVTRFKSNKGSFLTLPKRFVPKVEEATKCALGKRPLVNRPKVWAGLRNRKWNLLRASSTRSLERYKVSVPP